MSKVSVCVGMLVASVSVVAWADGAEGDYDHAEPAVARSLAPNEYLVNADGAQEDPQHRMSDTARAYRNGLIAGRREEADRQARTPPLPPLPHAVAEDDNSHYTSIPQQQAYVPRPPVRAAAAMVAPVPTPVSAQQQLAYQPPPAQMVAYEPPPQPMQPRQAAYQQPPVQYVQTQNVYPQGSQGFAYSQADDERSQAYAPPPAPVYVASAEEAPVQYVYAPPPSPPVMIVRPRRLYRQMQAAYWQQPGYVARYADQPTYAYYQPRW